MRTAYRIFKSKYADAWFDAEGAYRFGGRWNSPGSRLLYTSASQSLALLEILVHIDHDRLVQKYSVATITFDDVLMTDVSDIAVLPTDWNKPTVNPELQEIGDLWSRSRQSVVLKVPSVIVPAEANFLINAAHPDFGALMLGEAQPFLFDSRLIDRTRVG